MQPLCGQWPGETAPFLSPFAPLLRETPYAFAFLKAPRKRVIRNFLFCKRPRGKAASCKKLSTISTADPLQGDTGGRFWRKAAKFSASAVDNAVHTCGKVRDIHRFTPVFAGDTACQANRCKKISTIYAHNSTLTPKFGGKLPLSTKTGTCVQKNYQQFLQNVFIKSDLYTLLPFPPPPLWKTAVRLFQKNLRRTIFAIYFCFMPEKVLTNFENLLYYLGTLTYAPLAQLDRALVYGTKG